MVHQETLIEYLQNNNFLNLYDNNYDKFKTIVSDKTDPVIENFIYRTLLYNNRKIANGVFGFLSTLADDKVYPINDNDSIKLNTTSANGKFCIFKSKKDNTPIFLKVSQGDDSDALEIESVVLKTLNQYDFSPKYISSCIACTNAGRMDFGSILHSPDYKPVAFNQCIVTEAIVPGFSLGYIIKTLETAINGNALGVKEKQDMELFFRNSFINRLGSNAKENNKFITDNYSVFIKNVYNRIIFKLEDLYKNILSMKTDLCFTHGDMHMDNILYDMKTDAFVLIDYGRSYVNLDSYTKKDLLVFSDKLQTSTVPGSENWNKKSQTDAFYDMYYNDLVRRSGKNKNILNKYNVLHDFVGLSFLIFKTFYSYLKDDMYNKDIIQIDEKMGVIRVNKKFLNIVSNMNDTNSIFLFTLYYFVFIVSTMLPKLRGIQVMSGDISLEAQYSKISIDTIFGDSTPFYFAGQFMPSAFNSIYPDLSKNILKYSSLLEEKIESFKVKTGGAKNKKSYSPPNKNNYSTFDLIENYQNNNNKKYSLANAKNLKGNNYFKS